MENLEKGSYLEAELKIKRAIEEKWNKRLNIRVEKASKEDIIIVKKQPKESETQKENDKQEYKSIKEADGKAQPKKPIALPEHPRKIPMKSNEEEISKQKVTKIN
jgi:hypothetical protein